MRLYIHFIIHFITFKTNTMYTSGEKPGKGTYKCQKCGKEVTLDDNSELPICPVCGHNKWDRID
ncbi:MAG: hypothetical protein R6U46_08075 [Marinilabilia sp.]